MSTAESPQGAKAPVGGSGAHAELSRARGFTAGPPRGEARPPPGAATRVAAERGGKISRRPVHGVLLLDKPIGLSSNQALQKVKWLLRAEKAGHTGTLDPLATGVLPLCFGAATKFSQMHLDADKAYETVLRLGVKTTTADAEGDVISERPVQVSTEQLDQVVRRFTGPIRQIPPMHSALKKDGKALYEYARAGIEVERAPRDVTIFSLKVLENRIQQAQPAIKMVVECSKGTYIRTLGEDIGEALGCGAHLSALRRIRTGGFDATQCITLEALEAMSETERLAQLMPVDALLKGHTVVTLDSENAGRFLSGMRRRGPWPDAHEVAVYAASAPGAGPPQTWDGPHGGQRPARAVERVGHVHLLGTARVKAGELIPVRLLSPLEIGESLAQQQLSEQLVESEP